MSVEATLAAGRAFAESLMTDTCRIGNWVRSDTPDPDTLEYEYVLDAVYSGPCECLTQNVQAQNVDAAGQLLVNQLVEVRVPIEGTGAITDGMRVIFDTSATDPALAGTHARIEAPFRSAHTTARRFSAQVVS